MAKQTLFKQNLLLLVLFSICVSFINAQNAYNVNSRTLVFLAANKVHKVGTDGSGVGNKTLYTNVITIGSQQIDCIVTTVSLSNGSFALPSSPASGTIPFDYSSNSGSGMSANEDSFFSPTMTWNSNGGNCRFNFQFIAGGSYNNSTNTGTNVILQNVFVNTYDIDGNGGSGSNQFNAFGGFSTTQFQTATGGYIQSIFDFSVNKTKFRSTTNSNITNVTDDRTRVKVFYNSLSSFDFVVGSEGSGAAYYFLDFGQGPAWTNTPSVQTPPSVDLYPNNTSTDKSTDITNCNQTVKFTYNGSNVSSSADIDTVYLEFTSSDILDGSSEQLIIDSATSGGTIALNFANNASIPNIVLKGSTYNVKVRVSSGISKMMFYQSGATMTNTEAENLVSSFAYVNTNCSTLSLGTRSFLLNVFQIPFISNTVQFDLNIIVPLPVKFIDFTAKEQADFDYLTWTVADDIDAKAYEVQGSINAVNFNTIQTLSSKQLDQAMVNYSATVPSFQVYNYYRITANKVNGQLSFSPTVFVARVMKSAEFNVYPNPMGNEQSSLKLNTNEPFVGAVKVINANGVLVYSKAIQSVGSSIEITDFYAVPGIYTILLETEQTVKSIKWIKSAL